MANENVSKCRVSWFHISATSFTLEHIAVAERAVAIHKALNNHKTFAKACVFCVHMHESKSYSLCRLWKLINVIKQQISIFKNFQFKTLCNTRSSPYVTPVKPSLSLKVTHRFFRHASPHRWNQLTHQLEFLIWIIHPPLRRPSFEHAGPTCYTLLSPSITFHFFTLSSKPTFSKNLILHLRLFLWVRLISLTLFPQVCSRTCKAMALFYAFSGSDNTLSFSR